MEGDEEEKEMRSQEGRVHRSWKLQREEAAALAEGYIPLCLNPLESLVTSGWLSSRVEGSDSGATPLASHFPQQGLPPAVATLDCSDSGRC